MTSPNTIGAAQRELAVQTDAAGGNGALLRYYGLMFWRWRKVVAAIVVAALALGVVVTLLMTPKYTATSQIEIQRDSATVVNVEGVEQDATDSDQEFYQTQYGLLRSRSLAERIARELKLVTDYEFFEMHGEHEELFSVGGGEPRPIVDRGQLERKAASILLDNVRVAPQRQSRLVDIDYTSPSAELSQRIANAWAENFIEMTLERRYDASSYAREFLEGRLGELRESLDQSERALQTYAQDRRIITLPGAGRDGSEQSTVAFDLVALNSELAAATAARVQAQARLEALRGRAGEAQESLENNTLNQLRATRAETEAEYQKLLSTFEPAYPPAVALRREIDNLDSSIAREERRVGGSIDASYRAALERENRLQARVSELEGQFLDQRRLGIQYRVLGREVDTNRQLYDALLQRYKEIGVAGGVGVNNISIIDLADLPQRPSSPRIVLNLLLALIGGLAIGMVAAYLLDQSDETLTDPSDAERLIGLPLLGSVPKDTQEEPNVALLDSKSVLFDAYLSVQTSLQFSTASGVPRAVAVTSTRPGEGKSTTALALATLLARSQRKVVLIDGDMRSPSVHHLIGTDHSKGLSSYLSGHGSAHEFLTEKTEFGFHAMTAGPIPPNAAELLSGDRLSKLIAELHEEYDHVVIDAPPVMGFADVPLIAGRVDGVVYTVEAHGVRMGMVRNALERLASTNARLLGVVVTKFVSEKSAKGYGYSYGYEYGEKSTARDV